MEPGTVGSAVEPYVSIRAPRSVRWMAGGDVLLIDRPDGVYQLFRRSADAPIGEIGTQLTDFEDGVDGYALSPERNRAIVTASIGGSEQTDIFEVNLDEGGVTPLLSSPDVLYRFGAWLDDQSGFLFLSNEANGRDMFLYRRDFATGETTQLTDEPGYWGVSDVTDDASRVLMWRYESVTSSEVFELDVATGELRDLTARREDGTAYSNSAEGYLPGERRVFIVTDRVNGVPTLETVDLETAARTLVFDELPRGVEVDSVRMNRKKTVAAVSFNDRGFGTVELYDLPGMTLVESSALREAGGQGIVSVADLWLTDGSLRVMVGVSGSRSPGLRYELGLDDETLEPITEADAYGLNIDGFTLPKLVTYESFDGLEIPAFLYEPEGGQGIGARPYIVWFHGGPEGQHRPGFRGELQYFIDQGFGVLLPNVRGSRGYGREFVEMDNGPKRWDSVRDGVWAAKWLVEQGIAEPGRIGAMGGSYGGFMSVAVPIEDQRLAERENTEPLYGAAINVVGIVNFETFLRQTKSYRRALREVEYGSLDDTDMLARISPINQLEYLRVPMLIAHGLNDPRVPVGEAMQLAVELQKRGEDPEQLYFADEGHGFRKLSNRLLYYGRVARFLERHIGEAR